MLCANLDGRGVWGRMDTCTRMAESLLCSPETIMTQFSNWLYPNIKAKIKKKKRKEKKNYIKRKTKATLLCDGQDANLFRVSLSSSLECGQYLSQRLCMLYKSNKHLAVL